MLDVAALETVYYRDGKTLEAVRKIDLTVPAGSTVALVGESGSGKSTVAKSIMRLVERPSGEIVGGQIRLNGVDLLKLDRREMRRQLMERIGYVPQDPSTALDPLYRVGSQVQEVLERLPKKMRSEATATLFDRLGVVPGRQRMREYPHQFSGGMQQRVAIAIALAKGPALLIADEPTTALDVTTQLSILRLLDELRRQEGLTTLLITHNLAVARLVCQQIAVMYGGIIVEAGPTDSLLRAPRHPYTRALIAASLEEAPPRTPLRTVAGQAPRLDEMPSGCPFAPRCAHVIDECRAAIPPVTTIDVIQVRCIRAGSI